MHVLMLQLQRACYGCHIGDKYIGALVYADYVILLGSTITLQLLMLNTGNNFDKEFDLKFNSNESQYFVFGNSKSIPEKFNDTHLSPVKSVNCRDVIIDETVLMRLMINALNNMFKFC